MSINQTRLMLRFMLFALQTFASFVMWNSATRAPKEEYAERFRASARLIEDIRTELEST